MVEPISRSAYVFHCVRAYQKDNAPSEEWDLAVRCIDEWRQQNAPTERAIDKPIHDFVACVNEQYDSMTIRASFDICMSRMFPKDEEHGTTPGDTAYAGGKKMWYVDRAWLLHFGNCMAGRVHAFTGTGSDVEFCIRESGEEMSGSRSEGLPDKREGDGVEASPVPEDSTHVNRSRTPLLDLVKKNVEYEDRKKAVGHFIPRINEFVEAMAPETPEPRKIGVWRVEPDFPAEGSYIWDDTRLQVPAKRKTAVRWARELSREHGEPFRVAKIFMEAQ